MTPDPILSPVEVFRGIALVIGVVGLAVIAWNTYSGEDTRQIPGHRNDDEPDDRP